MKSVICPKCGTKFNEKYCPYCGHRNKSSQINIKMVATISIIATIILIFILLFSL